MVWPALKNDEWLRDRSWFAQRLEAGSDERLGLSSLLGRQIFESRQSTAHKMGRVRFGEAAKMEILVVARHLNRQKQRKKKGSRVSDRNRTRPPTDYTQEPASDLLSVVKPAA